MEQVDKKPENKRNRFRKFDDKTQKLRIMDNPTYNQDINNAEFLDSIPEDIDKKGQSDIRLDRIWELNSKGPKV